MIFKMNLLHGSSNVSEGERDHLVMSESKDGGVILDFIVERSERSGRLSGHNLYKLTGEEAIHLANALLQMVKI